VLRPGQREEVTLSVVTPMRVGSLPFEVYSFGSPDQDGLGDRIDLAAIEYSLAPPDPSTESWEPLFDRFIAQVGPTWGDYLDTVRTNADELAETGARTRIAEKLLGFELVRSAALGTLACLESAQDVCGPALGLSPSDGSVAINGGAGSTMYADVMGLPTLDEELDVVRDVFWDAFREWFWGREPYWPCTRWQREVWDRLQDYQQANGPFEHIQVFPGVWATEYDDGYTVWHSFIIIKDDEGNTYRVDPWLELEPLRPVWPWDKLFEGDLDLLVSYTPEDKFGPAGYDPEGASDDHLARWTAADAAFNYRIEFWNKEDAPVPTQDAIIIDRIDPTKFDLGTLEFTRVGFLNWDMPLADGQMIDTVIDCRPEMNIAVEIKAGLGMQVPGFANNSDIDENTMVWWFHAIDPLTGEWPEDPMAGFLPPFNPETEFEIGWIEYSVDPVAGLDTGTTLENVAYVEFDFAGDIYDHPAPKIDPDVEPAEPMPWVNTIDADAPESSVAAMASARDYNLFMVNWSGTDVGSGVATCDIYVREDDEAWTLWLSDTSETIGWYTGRSGHDYSFYSVARDNVGNVEEAPVGLVPDAATTINAAVELDLGDDVAPVEGETFSLAGNVGNLPPGSTATVNYGDGQGQMPLALGGDGSFNLGNIFADDGVFEVVVAVTDPFGTTVSDELLATVANVAPAIDSLTGDSEAEEGQQCSFTASASDVAGAADPLTYEWDFGDGSDLVSGVDLTDVDHTYSQFGDYTVTLTVTDGDGGADTAVVAVHVDPVTPLPGDADLDGFANDDDLAILLANWEQDPGRITRWGLGDFTADTDVNDDDLAVLLANWTGGSPVGVVMATSPQETVSVLDATSDTAAAANTTTDLRRSTLLGAAKPLADEAISTGQTPLGKSMATETPLGALANLGELDVLPVDLFARAGRLRLSARPPQDSHGTTADDAAVPLRWRVGPHRQRWLGNTAVTRRPARRMRRRTAASLKLTQQKANRHPARRMSTRLDSMVDLLDLPELSVLGG